MTRLEREESEGAVHGAGIDIDVAEVVSDETGDGAFA